MLHNNASEIAELSLRRISKFAEEQSPAYAILSCAAVVEAYVDQVIDALIDARALDSLGEFLLDKTLESIHGNWEERRNILKVAFLVNVEGDAIATDFRVLIEARNALAHGNGSLTTRQTKAAGKALGLQRSLYQVLSVSTQGHRIIVGPNSGALAAECATKYLLAIDKRVSDLYPAMPI